MQYKGTCHCKNIEFEVETNLEKILQCNCSICIRRNAKMIMIPKENFTLTKGENDLALYQFNSNIAKHYFCKKCGIYTHHNRKSDPNGMGVNLGCLEELDATEYDAIAFDGRKPCWVACLRHKARNDTVEDNPVIKPFGCKFCDTCNVVWR